MAVAGMGGVAAAGMAAASWASMSGGFKNMGTRTRAAIGVLDPFSSAIHGFTGSFRGAAMNAGVDGTKMYNFGTTMKHGYAGIMKKGGLRGLAGAGARGLAIGGASMLPAMAIGGALSYGIRQAGAGAGEFMSTSGTMHEIAEYTGMRGGFSSDDVGVMENSIQSMMSNSGDLGAQRSDIMGLMRTAGAAGEFRNTGDVKKMSKKFKKLVSEYKAVSKMMDTDLATAYSMAKSFGKLGYFDSGSQRDAMVGVTMGARGTGLAADTIMTSMATGVQAAPGMGISRRSGSDLGRTMTTGLGHMLNTDTGFAKRVFEKTGLQGDQAAFQLTSQWMGHRAQMQQNPVTQAVIAASMTESGGVDEWKLNQILSGGMSGDALMKASQKAMKNKRIASMVATRGGDSWKRINEIAGPERLAASLGQMTSDVTGMTIDASMMSTTGMDNETYRLMQQVNRAAPGAAVEGQMRGLEGRLGEMQSKQIKDMIDPRNIVGREWQKVKNKISKPFRDAGRELMQRTVKFIEEQTADLQSQLITYTDSGWNTAFKTAFAGGGVTDFYKGAQFLATLEPGYGALGGLSTSMPLSSGGGLGGVGGTTAVPLSMRAADDDRFGTTLDIGAGGGVSGVTMSSFTARASGWAMDAGMRETTRTLTGSQSANFAGGFRNMGAGGTIGGAITHPLGLGGMGAIGRGVGRVGASVAGWGMRQMQPLQAAEGIFKSAASAEKAGKIGKSSRLLKVATKYDKLARGSRVLRGVSWAGGATAGALGTGVRAIGGVARALGPAATAATLGIAAWDAYQFEQDAAARNLAVERDEWYGYAASAFVDTENLVAPTPDFAAAISGDIAKFGQADAGAMSVFASSFVGGFGELFSEGFTNRTDAFFGVDRGLRRVEKINVGGGRALFSVGTPQQMRELRGDYNARLRSELHAVNTSTAVLGDNSVTLKADRRNWFQRAGGTVLDAAGTAVDVAAENSLIVQGTKYLAGQTVPAALRNAGEQARQEQELERQARIDRAKARERSSIRSVAAAQERAMSVANDLRLSAVMGRSDEGAFAYSSAKYQRDILFTETQVNSIGSYARRQAKLKFGLGAGTGLNNKRLNTFTRSLQRRSTAFSPTVQRKILRGEWDDPTVRKEIRSSEGGAAIVEDLDAIRAGAKAENFGLVGAEAEIGADVAGSMSLRAIQSAMAAGSDGFDWASASRDKRYGDMRTALIKRISKDPTASGLHTTGRHVRKFTHGLAESIGAGRVARSTITAAAKGELDAGDARKVFSDLGMIGTLEGYVDEEKGWDKLLTEMVGVGSLDMKRQTKEQAEAWRSFAADTAQTLEKGGVSKRMAGLGFASASGVVNKFIDFNKNVSTLGVDYINRYGSELMQEQSDITNEFYSEFGSMTSGQRNLMMKQIASNSALQGMFGRGAANINAAIGMGVEVRGIQKKKGAKKSARARFKSLEAYTGQTFGADEIDMWGMGNMKDPRVTLGLQEKMQATFQAQYGDTADVSKYTKLGVEYLAKSGSYDEKQMQRLMTEMASEKTRLEKKTASPQTATATANKDVIDKLTELMEPGGKNVFTQMVTALDTINSEGIKVQVPDEAGGTGEEGSLWRRTMG